MKLAVFLADGFEEIEALTVVDYLKRVDVQSDMISISDEKNVKGAHGIEVVSNKLIDDIKIEDYDGVIIPGGLPGATNLQEDERVIQMVQAMNEKEGLVGSICAGPVVLQEAGVLKGKKVTSFPGFEDQLTDGEYVEDNVVIDGNIITSRGPALAVEFALSVAEYLKGEDIREELEESILYKMLMK